MPETGNKISFDTAKTVLVPVELYEKGAEKDYLRFNGMALTADEVAVASEPQGGIVAVMGVSAEEWSRYRDEYERGGVVVTSPLLAVATEGGPGAEHDRDGGRGGDRDGGCGRGWGRKRGRRAVDLLLTDENLYLAVRDGGLRMAEVLPDNSVDSILYYLQVVGRQFRLRKFDINVSGQKAGLVADALRHYYKKVRVGTEATT